MSAIRMPNVLENGRRLTLQSLMQRTTQASTKVAVLCHLLLLRRQSHKQWVQHNRRCRYSLNLPKLRKSIHSPCKLIRLMPIQIFRDKASPTSSIQARLSRYPRGTHQRTTWAVESASRSKNSPLRTPTRPQHKLN